MICPNCGKELAEGEICSCTAPEVTPINPQPEYTAEPQPAEQSSYYDPSSSQQAYYNPIPPEPPVYYGNAVASTDYPQGYKIKKKYVAVILGAALGCLGIHNFYLGNNGKAIAQILLTTVGSILVVGPIVSCVWALIETVLLLTESIDADANGYKIQTLEEALNPNKN